MSLIFYIIIIFLGASAYTSAVYQVLSRHHYKPNLFSRGIWFLLGINSFAGVVLSGGSKPSIILAGILLIGNAALFFISIKKSNRIFGTVEKASLGLLLISGVLWIVLDLALLNLIIGLVAHFIGGLPTFKRVLDDARSEQVYHWYFFALASFVAIIASPTKDIGVIIFPLYFLIFDLSIIILANRKYLRSLLKKKTSSLI